MEVIDQITDGELDLAYIDGDHKLKGISIDLIRVYPKVRVGGFLCGDDFTRSVWEHKTSFEPTLVFPSLFILLRRSALQSSRCLTRSSAFTKRLASNSQSST
jgi:hypothetical protein